MVARTPLAWPLAALAAFAALLAVVALDWSPLLAADKAISEAFRAYGSDHPGVVSVVRVATDVMSTVSFLAIGCAAAILLAAQRRWRAAGLCAAVAVAVPVLWSLLHWALYNPRPRDGFVATETNGFPSGHTSHAGATALTVVLLLWPHLRGAALAVATAAAAGFAVAIGVTRVALLAHWPSDVLGGWLLALTVVPLLATAFEGVTREGNRAQ